MRKPYYRVTARCENERCPETVFVVDRKKIIKTATSGMQYRIDRVVCPSCRQWQPITDIQEIKA